MNKKRKSSLNRHVGADIVTYVVMIVYAIFLLFPFCILLITSLSSQTFLTEHLGFAIPGFRDLTFSNYDMILISDPLFQLTLDSGGTINILLLGFINTLWQVIPTTLIGLIVSGLAAYAYAKLNFPGKKILFAIQIGIIVLPTATLTIPSYVFYYQLGWVGTCLPVIIPGMFGSAVTIFYLTQYFKSIPTEVFEAAKLDGLGTFGIYFRIILPLSVPAFVAQGILNFAGGYNNFLGALLYLNEIPELRPLQLALYNVNGMITNGSGYNAGIACASVLISMLPLIIIYIILRKQFRQGITDGAVK